MSLIVSDTSLVVSYKATPKQVEEQVEQERPSVAEVEAAGQDRIASVAHNIDDDVNGALEPGPGPEPEPEPPARGTSPDRALSMIDQF